MSWEEELPSLKNKYKYVEEFPKSWYVVPMLDVGRECLDKQRVKEAINKLGYTDEGTNRFIAVDDLKKELGLE